MTHFNTIEKQQTANRVARPTRKHWQDEALTQL